MSAISNKINQLETLIKHIQDALGTEETGEALIKVARNAHMAELELASWHKANDRLQKEHE